MTTEEMLRRIAELEAENERLLNELRKARVTIANAKDIEPIQRLSEKRVAKMAASACLELVRHKVKGWLIRMGNKSQWYESLWDIWAILSGDDWKLSEIIPSSVPPKLAREARLLSSLEETKCEIEDALPKEESIVLDNKPRDYNFKRIPPRDKETRTTSPKTRSLQADRCSSSNSASKSLFTPQIQWEWDKSLVPFS